MMVRVACCIAATVQKTVARRVPDVELLRRHDGMQFAIRPAFERAWIMEHRYRDWTLLLGISAVALLAHYAGPANVQAEGACLKGMTANITRDVDARCLVPATARHRQTALDLWA